MSDSLSSPVEAASGSKRAAAESLRCSSSVFQALQPGHWPCQRIADMARHDEPIRDAECLSLRHQRGALLSLTQDDQRHLPIP